MLLNVVHININVSDIERSLVFYQKLGFAVMHVFGGHDLLVSIQAAESLGPAVQPVDHRLGRQ